MNSYLGLQQWAWSLVAAFALLFLGFLAIDQFAHGFLGLPGILAALALVAVAGVITFRLVERERRRGAEAEARLHALEEQVVAIQRTESVSLLAAGIAHDFNNVLASIIPNVELARAVLPGDSMAHPMLDEIAGASERGAQLSQRLLGYTRRTPAEPGEVALQDVVERVRPLFASASRTANVSYDLAPSLPPAWGDGTQLAQVVMNLVLNSIESIGPAHGTISVETGIARPAALSRDFLVCDGELREDDEVLYLRVADDGPGVPPGVARRIFEPFFSTKATGTGLGLAATAGIVRSHGGTIGLANGRDGRGAVFTVLLPCSGSPALEGVCGREGSGCTWRATDGRCTRESAPAPRDELAELLRRLPRRTPATEAAGNEASN